MKNLVKSVLPKSTTRILSEAKKIALDGYASPSYSQEGEDRILERFLGYREHGFYVDVGAHHPQRFSNTYLFYKRGWSGINIDATPGSMRLFERLRPRDINLEMGISKDKLDLEFRIFNEPALNTFNADISERRHDKNEYHVIEAQKISTHRLEDVLTQYVALNQTIDFLTVDVEGLDLEVIQSSNWQRFRPKYVLVECLEPTVDGVLNTDICKFLGAQQYSLVAKTFNTGIFKNSDSP
ncbi:MAG: FkbM family methyltransferase [Myxacorys chilensis ATA2-1-KO14]|nr:FkbM family methyltransferase [Myxacorys chilensis ATA2-1-KO14]